MQAETSKQLVEEVAKKTKVGAIPEHKRRQVHALSVFNIIDRRPHNSQVILDHMFKFL